MKKLSEKFYQGSLLILIIAFLILAATFAVGAQTIEKWDGHYIVTLNPDPVHNKIAYSLYSEQAQFFSDLVEMPFNKPFEIMIIDSVQIWLVGDSETTSIWICVPRTPKEWMLVIINGQDQRTKKKYDRSLWAYEEIVPLIKEYYSDKY